MLPLAEDIYGKNEPKDDAETNVITIVFGSFSDRFPKFYFYRIKILQSLMKADFHTIKFLNFGSF